MCILTIGDVFDVAYHTGNFNGKGGSSEGVIISVHGSHGNAEGLILRPPGTRDNRKTCVNLLVHRKLIALYLQLIAL